MKHNFPLTIKVHIEKEQTETPYVAHISEFDISSCGKSEKQAIKNAKLALCYMLDKQSCKVLYMRFSHSASTTYRKTLSLPKVVGNHSVFIYLRLENKTYSLQSFIEVLYGHKWTHIRTR